MVIQNHRVCFAMRLILGVSVLTFVMLLIVFLVAIFVSGCHNDVEEPVGPLDAPAAPMLFQKECPNFLHQNKFRMVRIPSGHFTMGNDLTTGNFRTPKFRTRVKAFWIDKYEVTVSEFDFFLEESGYRRESKPPELVEQIKGEPGHPAQVTWRDAWAYSIWVGKRLPTEREWEKAARGGREGETFTWGNSQPLPGSRRIGFAKEGGFAVAGGNLHFNGEWLTGIRSDLQYVFDTGLYEPNGYDLFDMIGNVGEWCQDDWNANAYLLFIADPNLEAVKVEGLHPDWHHIEMPLSNWKVVRGGGLRHSLFVSSQRERFDELTIQQQQQFIRETIDIGERTMRYMSDYYLVGFRCAMDD